MHIGHTHGYGQYTPVTYRSATGGHHKEPDLGRELICSLHGYNLLALTLDIHKHHILQCMHDAHCGHHAFPHSGELSKALRPVALLVGVFGVGSTRRTVAMTEQLWEKFGMFLQSVFGMFLQYTYKPL